MSPVPGLKVASCVPSLSNRAKLPRSGGVTPGPMDRKTPPTINFPFGSNAMPPAPPSPSVSSIPKLSSWPTSHVVSKVPSLLYRASVLRGTPLHTKKSPLTIILPSLCRAAVKTTPSQPRPTLAAKALSSEPSALKRASPEIVAAPACEKSPTTRIFPSGCSIA